MKRSPPAGNNNKDNDLLPIPKKEVARYDDQSELGSVALPLWVLEYVEGRKYAKDAVKLVF